MEELTSYKKQIQARINSYNNLKKHLEELDKITNNSPQDPFEMEFKLDSILTILRKFPIGSSEEKLIEKELSEVKARSQKTKSDVVNKFAIDFNQLMIREGRSVSGRVPKIRSGLFTWEIDTNKGLLHLWWGNEKQLLSDTIIDAKTAIDELKKYEAAIISREINHVEFIKTLFRAYKMEIARSDLRTGEPAEINRVFEMFNFLQKMEKKEENDIALDSSFQKVRFSFDLYRLKEKKVGRYEFGMNTATLASTKSPENFLWIPMNEAGEGTVVSHIVFKEVNS